MVKHLLAIIDVERAVAGAVAGFDEAVGCDGLIVETFAGGFTVLTAAIGFIAAAVGLVAIALALVLRLHFEQRVALKLFSDERFYLQNGQRVRSEEGRVGNEGVERGRSRWSQEP